MHPVYEQIREIKLVPVVKIDDVERAVPLAQALVKGGLPCAEVTFRTDCAEEAIRRMSQAVPELLVGAGTILNTEQVDRAIAAGAKFVVSPGLNPEVVAYCVQRDIIILPGCANASDIEQAIRFGLPVVKFFPAENAGGLKMIQALAAPYHQMLFMPTGGINEKNVRTYLDCPKILACGGSWMVKDSLINQGDFEEITRLCREAAALIMPEKFAVTPKKLPSGLANLQKKKTFDAVALGEMLLRLSPEGMERIAESDTFVKNAGGAELNVLSGLSLLGRKTAMLSKLPKNKLGNFMLGKLRQKGVDGSFLAWDDRLEARLGVYLYEQGASPRKPSVVYDRKNSSFLTYVPEDICPDIYAQTRLFYTSGITLGVSEQVCKAAGEMMRRFKEAGAAIAFDVNYRAALWSEEQSREAISKLLPLVDVLFISEESSRRMFRKTGTLEEIMKEWCGEYGISIVCTSRRTVKDPQRHNFGSLIYVAAEDRFYEEPDYEDIQVVDRIGSGDSFVAGALHGILEGDYQEAVAAGNAMAALKITVPGDLPVTDAGEVERVMTEHRATGPKSEMDR